MNKINWPHGFFVLLTLVFYCIIGIAAGHGLGIIGMLLIIGDAEAWALLQIPSYLGALLLIGSILNSRFAMALTVSGTCILTLTIVCSALFSLQEIHVFWLTAIPYFLSSTLLAVFSYIDRR